MKLIEDIGVHALLQRHENSQSEYQKMIYAVSHDLAAPIRSVVSFAKLLQKNASDKLDEKELHYLSYIIDSGEKAQAMFLGLLEYSRLLTRSEEPARLDANDVVRAALELLVKPIKASGADITVDKLPNVYAEPNQLGRVFFSLIENAVKFRRKDSVPEIHIAAQRYGKGYKFTVTDNGIGLDMKYGEAIFDVFKRLNGEKEFPGIGMGLPIARRIMDLHHGEIWVDSTPGKGSVFSFFFPDFSPSGQR